MDELRSAFDDLIAQLRSETASDAEFAQEVARVCSEVVDRAAADFGNGPGQLIRDLFRLL